jgi:hypothetical protein
MGEATCDCTIRSPLPNHNRTAQPRCRSQKGIPRGNQDSIHRDKDRGIFSTNRRVSKERILLMTMNNRHCRSPGGAELPAA